MQVIKSKIDGVNIQEVSAVKYLGVSFDSTLTWKNHANELCLKLSKAVGIFSKLRYQVYVDTPYTLLFTYLPLSYLWRPSLGSDVPNLPKTSAYFAKTSRQNNDFLPP